MNVFKQLQTWSKTWFSTRFATRFSTSSCGFATRFRPAFGLFVENLVVNLLHQARHVEIDATGFQHDRWFVPVLDKWNVEKKPVSSQPTNLLKLEFRYVFYYSCLS